VPESVISAHASRREQLERRRHNQSVELKFIEKMDAVHRPEHEHCRGDGVREHRRIGEDRRADRLRRGIAAARIEDVMPGRVGRLSFVVA